jgi:hypothetical protein
MALLYLGCGSSPTQPAPPAATVTITITSLSPATPTASDAAQTLTVAGSNFATGLSVSLHLADGSTSTLSASQIHDVTANAFQMTVTLNAAGTSSLTVTNTSGSSSSAFGFTVQAAPPVAPTPRILSITPPLRWQSDAAQPIYVSGTDFVDHLGATVTAPDGTSITIDASQILNLTTTSCQINLAFTQAGLYQLTVNAPSGPSSNAMPIIVQPVSHSFTLSGVVQDTDAAFAPIAGAKVTVQNGDWIGRSAITDASGGYRLQGLSGLMTVQASKLGYTSETLSVTQTNDQTLNFALSHHVALVNEFFGLFRPQF